MSVRSEMFSRFSNSFGNMVDSGFNLAKTTVTQMGKENQRQEQKDQLIKSDQDVLVSLYTKELGEKLKTLPDSIDIDSYGPEMDKFSNDFVSARRNEGIYREESLEWLENSFIPSQKAQNEASVGEIQNYVTNSWLATRASSKASELAANPDMTVDQAYEEYKAYYESTRLANIPSGYGILLPETFREAIREPKAEQAFERLALDPVKGYTYSGSFDKAAAMEQARKEAGYSTDSLKDPAFEKSCDAILKEIYNERQAAATSAQNEISSKYMAKSLDGEEWTVSELIDEAREMGAFRPDGTVDTFWTTYLSRYLDEYLKEKEAEQKAQELAQTVEDLTVDGVLDSATAVMGGNVIVPRNQAVVDSNRGFRDADAQSMVTAGDTPYTYAQKKSVSQPYSRQRAIEEKASRLAVEASGIEGQAVDEGRSQSVVDASRGFRDVEAEQGQGPDFGRLLEENGGDYHKATLAYAEALIGMGRKEDVANMLAFEEADRYSDEERENARREEEKPFVMDSGFSVPEEYPGAEGLSDRSAALAEASYMEKATQGTMFANAYKLGGDINWSAGYGKQTYKAEGQKDFQCDYEPIVAQYCRDRNIAYDTKSAEVYAIAQMVQTMGDAGYFSDQNKSLAVQVLSAARNDPEQATTYKELALSYVTQGILTPDELKDYGLDSSAYNVSQLAGTKYSQTLDVALDRGFSALFGDVKGKTLTAKVNNLSPEQSILWEDVKAQMTDAVQTAFYSDATGAGEDYLDTAQQIVDKYANTAWVKQLYKEITKNLGYVRVHSYPNGITAENRRYDEYQSTSGILQSYFSTLNDEDPMYSEFLDAGIVEDVTNGKWLGTTKEVLNAISQELYSLDMDDDALTPYKKSTVLFSYLYGQTQKTLKSEVCNSFGYSQGEAYGNVIVHPTNGQGGGFAVVTKDGRVYMSAGVPDASGNRGHSWLIGSVDNQTLKRIDAGLTDLSFNDISYNGIYQFDDYLNNFGKEGLAVSGSRENRKMKEQELNEIYRKLQPSRFKY